MICRRDDEGSEIGRLLVRLSSSDRQVVVRLVRHIAGIEAEHGEDVALAVAQQMERAVCGRLAA